ncbi:hypothetical protein [Natrinema sp. HArc-T2]|uniref:hypothetical protein n=1 Tax=Natrinema sp. HArc-T2 TaxID=3242701 RepID=UPI00359E2BC6
MTPETVCCHEFPANRDPFAGSPKLTDRRQRAHVGTIEEAPLGAGPLRDHHRKRHPIPKEPVVAAAMVIDTIQDN